MNLIKMELEQDTGYICSACWLPILESDLFLNKEKDEYYHKE